jgi:hypothetical protein
MESNDFRESTKHILKYLLIKVFKANMVCE